MDGMFRHGEKLFNQQPDRSKKTPIKIDLAAALKRDAAQLSDEAERLRLAEIDRIYDLLMQEPERWDGLS
jgi:hypothetical protein